MHRTSPPACSEYKNRTIRFTLNSIIQETVLQNILPRYFENCTFLSPKIRPNGGEVTQRIANPFSLVQIQGRPPFLTNISHNIGQKWLSPYAQRTQI